MFVYLMIIQIVLFFFSLFSLKLFSQNNFDETVTCLEGGDGPAVDLGEISVHFVASQMKMDFYPFFGSLVKEPKEDYAKRDLLYTVGIQKENSGQHQELQLIQLHQCESVSRVRGDAGPTRMPA